MSEKEKEAKRQYSKSRYKEVKKNANLFLSCINEETLKFDENVANKKDFHASKEAVALDFVKSSKILVFDKFKHSENGSKVFIGYLHDDDVIRPCSASNEWIHKIF